MRLWSILFASTFVFLLATCQNKSSSETDPAVPVIFARTHFQGNRMDIKKVEELLNAKGDINAIDANSESLLHRCAWLGDVEGTKFLLAHKAQVNLKVPYVEVTPLHIAALQGHKEVVKILIEHKANVDYQAGKRNFSALLFAVDKGHKPVVELLLEFNANVHLKDVDGETGLHKAAFYNYLDIAKLLIGKGIDVNAKDKYGRTALHMAAFAEKVEAVEDENKKIHTVRKENSEMVRFLLEQKAQVNAKDTRGRTALDWADFYVHDDVSKILRENGAKNRLSSQESTEH